MKSTEKRRNPHKKRRSPRIPKIDRDGNEETCLIFAHQIFISYILENINRLLHENGESYEIGIKEVGIEESNSEGFSWKVKESKATKNESG